MTRKEKLKNVFKILSKVFIICGLAFYLGLSLFNIFYGFKEYREEKNDINRTVLRAPDFNIHSDNFYVIQRYDLDLTEDNYSFNVNTNFFSNSFNYLLFATIEIPFIYESSDLESLLFNSSLFYTNLVNNNIITVPDTTGVLYVENFDMIARVLDVSINGSNRHYNLVFTLVFNTYFRSNVNYQFISHITSIYDLDYGSFSYSFLFAKANDLNNYTLGYNTGFQQGYNDGVGSVDTQSIYNNGYNTGFQQGYNDGLNEDSEFMLRNALLTIFDIPLMYISSLLNFELLGVNFLGIFGALVTLGVGLWIIQKVL